MPSATATAHADTDLERQRAAVYVRISSDDQRDELGVRRQESMCGALLEVNGWTLHRIYCDNDRSASKAITNRPEFEALLADLRLGEFDRLVVVKQDRLVRKPDELEVVIRAMRAAGLDQLHTVKDGPVDLATTSGRTMARVMGVFDINYSETISEKVRDKKAELALRGVPSGGGSRPYGYEADGTTIRDAEADVIREAVRRVLAGESVYAITNDLNARGVPTVSGRPLVANSLKGTITGARIAGLRQHRGEVVGEATWPAIIDQDTRERLLVALAPRGRRGSTAMNRRLLTGLLICDRCKMAMYAAPNNGKPGYACVKRPEHRGCGRLAIAAEPLEMLIIDAALTVTDEARIIPVAPTPSTAASEIRALEERLDELATMYATGDLPRRSLEAANLATADKLEALRADLTADVDNTARTAAAMPYLAKPGLLRRSWKKMELTEQRVVLGALIDAITIASAVRGRHTFDPDRVDIDWADS